MILLGFGADALNPYLLWRVAVQSVGGKLAAAEILANTMRVLQKGIEKVMSTMGIHELCGYGRIFSGIGLGAELAGMLRTVNFCTSAVGGSSLSMLEDLGEKRYSRATGPERPDVYREPARNPRVGKILRQAALGKKDFSEMRSELAAVERDLPVGIRHLLACRKAEPRGSACYRGGRYRYRRS